MAAKFGAIKKVCLEFFSKFLHFTVKIQKGVKFPLKLTEKQTIGEGPYCTETASNPAALGSIRGAQITKL